MRCGHHPGTSCTSFQTLSTQVGGGGGLCSVGSLGGRGGWGVVWLHTHYQALCSVGSLGRFLLATYHHCQQAPSSLVGSCCSDHTCALILPTTPPHLHPISTLSPHHHHPTLIQLNCAVPVDLANLVVEQSLEKEG